MLSGLLLRRDSALSLSFFSLVAIKVRYLINIILLLILLNSFHIEVLLEHVLDFLQHICVIFKHVLNLALLLLHFLREGFAVLFLAKVPI